MMFGSGILDDCLVIKRVDKSKASHLAVYKGEKLRYLFDLEAGNAHLANSISTYSIKLKLLLFVIRYVPYKVLCAFGIGKYVSVELDEEIRACLNAYHYIGWNAIIGTYDEKQKIVLQLYGNKNDKVLYVKIGNSASDIEMRSEIAFLKSNGMFKTFSIPRLIGSCESSAEKRFNIMITEEFTGNKVTPGLTHEVFEIYKEIASIDSLESGYEFSHGDFAPWNLKRVSNGYIVFDWEHCGYRIKGFDLLHYMIVPKVMLDGVELEIAYKEALSEAQKFMPDIKSDFKAFKEEYERLRLG